MCCSAGQQRKESRAAIWHALAAGPSQLLAAEQQVGDGQAAAALEEIIVTAPREWAVSIKRNF